MVRVHDRPPVSYELTDGNKSIKLNINLAKTITKEIQMGLHNLHIGELVGKAQLLLAKTILRIKPEQKHKLKLKKFTWLEFLETARPVHCFYAVFGIAGVFTLSFLLTKIPILDLSIVGTLNLGIQMVMTKVFGISFDVTTFTTPVFIVLLVIWRNDVGSIYGVGPINLLSGLPWFAMREELAFRVGSEDWNFVEKIRGCISFGLLHFTMLVVPIGTALALSFGGAVFMAVYVGTYRKTCSRKLAARESATVHTLYNALLLLTLVVLIVEITLG